MNHFHQYTKPDLRYLKRIDKLGTAPLHNRSSTKGSKNSAANNCRFPVETIF